MKPFHYQDGERQRQGTRVSKTGGNEMIPRQTSGRRTAWAEPAGYVSQDANGVCLRGGHVTPEPELRREVRPWLAFHFTLSYFCGVLSQSTRYVSWEMFNTFFRLRDRGFVSIGRGRFVPSEDTWHHQETSLTVRRDVGY